MKIIKQSISADIAKDKFDACYSVLTQAHQVVVKATHKFANSAKGFTEFAKWVSKWEDASVESVIIMEATGVYYENLAWQLYRSGRSVIVVLPNRAKKYIQSLGYKSKNDRIDAKALAHMGAERRLDLWQPMSAQLYLLRKLTREHEQIQQMRAQTINRLHAEAYSMIAGKRTVKRHKKTLKLFDVQLKDIEQEIKTTIQADSLLKDKISNITSIKGVGLLTGATIIAETNGFALFTSQKQLTSYAGYDVVENQSGKRKGKTKISKQGNSHIRRILHMPAFTAVRKNVPVCKALYERLTAKGKKKMVAYVAVQKKLLLLIYTLWKKNEAWKESYYAQNKPAAKEAILSLEKEAILSLEKEAILSLEKEAILSLEVGASLSGFLASDQKKVAPTSRATQDEHPAPIGQGLSFRYDKDKKNSIKILDF